MPRLDSQAFLIMWADDVLSDVVVKGSLGVFPRKNLQGRSHLDGNEAP